MFLRQTPVGSVKDPATGEQQEKHVFVVFYAGERARTKVLKVCVCVVKGCTLLTCVVVER
jgi:V-type H+-transporting ATPase subunit a